MMKAPTTAASTAIMIFSLICAVFAFGCESSDDDGVASWNANGTSNSGDSGTVDPADTSMAAGDQVPFSSLSWSYGGVNGSGASINGVSISGLSVSGDTLSFRYNTNLSAWGMGYSNAGALCCLFVKNAQGGWKGGKFDWISSSRTSRNLENVLGGYNGWSLSGVPNPCEAAFVIISADGKRRSNVITSTWRR